jgi:hypothetical protein
MKIRFFLNGRTYLSSTETTPGTILPRVGETVQLLTQGAERDMCFTVTSVHHNWTGPIPTAQLNVEFTK